MFVCAGGRGRCRPLPGPSLSTPISRGPELRPLTLHHQMTSSPSPPLLGGEVGGGGDFQSWLQAPHSVLWTLVSGMDSGPWTLDPGFWTQCCLHLYTFHSVVRCRNQEVWKDGHRPLTHVHQHGRSSKENITELKIQTKEDGRCVDNRRHG